MKHCNNNNEKRKYSQLKSNEDVKTRILNLNIGNIFSLQLYLIFWKYNFPLHWRIKNTTTRKRKSKELKYLESIYSSFRDVWNIYIHGAASLYWLILFFFSFFSFSSFVNGCISNLLDIYLSLARNCVSLCRKLKSYLCMITVDCK